MRGEGLPLSHITVLDLTHYRAGPTAVRQLADWGANVIKVEAPPKTGVGAEDMVGKRHGFDYQNLHRNKRSICLDLKSEKGKVIFFDLCKKADVIVENFRTSIKYKLGIDYDEVKKVNPRIVYGSISGFGQTGPYADRPGVDQIAQGMGGLMSITGLEGHGPVRVGIPISDLCSGMFLAQGILLALIERERSGEGQWVHTSLLEAQIQMLDFQSARWLIAGEVPDQAGNHHPTLTPNGLFQTKDGYVNIGGTWPRFCKAVGREDLLERPEYSSYKARYENRIQLRAELEAITKTWPSKDLLAALSKQSVPCGEVYTIDKTFADPQVEHSGIVKDVEHRTLGKMRMVGQALNMSRTKLPPKMRLAAPEAGEHSDEILAELGYKADEIADLHARDVI